MFYNIKHMGKTQVFSIHTFIGINPILFNKTSILFLGNFIATFPSLQCSPAGFYWLHIKLPETRV